MLKLNTLIFQSHREPQHKDERVTCGSQSHRLAMPGITDGEHNVTTSQGLSSHTATVVWT